MNYRELLQKYKAGELPEEQRKQVRQDIEKQDAISEYLFDNEEMEFEEQVEQDGGQTTESTSLLPLSAYFPVQNVAISPANRLFSAVMTFPVLFFP